MNIFIKIYIDLLPCKKLTISVNTVLGIFNISLQTLLIMYYKQ